ncbi:MAG: hypothetical protein RLY58_537 [Pseudomonadota bacterium]|jgi:phage tail sheath gpL-like
MTIPAGLRRPDVYTDINTQTTRTGLPDNRQRVLLVSAGNVHAQPVAVYDKASADTLFGAGSTIGRMVKAAVAVNPFADLEATTLGEP